jgi:hypothetical protein
MTLTKQYMFELSDLVLLFVLGFILLSWWDGLSAKEIALSAARNQCRQLDLQLLDESIALRRFAIRRDAQGNPRLFRCYDFEFCSTGERRYIGKLQLAGKRVVAIEMEAHHFQI